MNSAINLERSPSQGADQHYRRSSGQRGANIEIVRRAAAQLHGSATTTASATVEREDGGEHPPAGERSARRHAGSQPRRPRRITASTPRRTTRSSLLLVRRSRSAARSGECIDADRPERQGNLSRHGTQPGAHQNRTAVTAACSATGTGPAVSGKHSRDPSRPNALAL